MRVAFAGVIQVELCVKDARRMDRLLLAGTCVVSRRGPLLQSLFPVVQSADDQPAERRELGDGLTAVDLDREDLLRPLWGPRRLRQKQG